MDEFIHVLSRGKAHLAPLTVETTEPGRQMACSPNDISGFYSCSPPPQWLLPLLNPGRGGLFIAVKDGFPWKEEKDEFPLVK